MIGNVSAPVALVSWALPRAGAVHILTLSQIVLGSVVNRPKQLHKWLRVILVLLHVSSPRSFLVFFVDFPPPVLTVTIWVAQHIMSNSPIKVASQLTYSNASIFVFFFFLKRVLGREILAI